MTKHNSWFFKALRTVQNWFVHTVVVPQQPFADLNLDADRPIVYVMKTESISDISSLSEVTESLGLPSPYDDIQIRNESIPRVVCLAPAKPMIGRASKANVFLGNFKQLLNLHQQDSSLDVQLLPVSMYWGRIPGKEDDTMKAAVLERESPTWFRKCLMILFLGRHNFIQFSNAVSLRYMTDEHGSDERIAHKLARVARVHFRRQRKVMTGPDLPNRQAMFKELLNSESIQKAINEQAASKKISKQEAKANAENYLDEIAANYSDSLVRIAERLLTWLWNKLYKGINIRGAELVRQLHHDGHEIVYVPCHRSHMDYLLLSYILYYEGMVPPHIAAGINLNFWPAGPMFRKGGAFFIRRSFNGNKLYTAVFKGYLDLLFNKGYSVEYFTEGGRSRTGRLLNPKTGMLAMTVSSVLRGIERPVTLVPVYLGYDHVMEVATYHKELSGKKKQKESVWQVFSAIRKLGNFGQGYVNFGEPINVQQHLSQIEPEWRALIAQDPEQKPTWLTPAVNSLANKVMTKINGATAVSSISLMSLIVLASEQKSLEKETIKQQLDFYLKLLTKVPYTEFSTVPEGNVEVLVSQALELNKFAVEPDPLGDIISLDDTQALNMTYYRNNIVHLFMVPSLIATLIIKEPQPTREKIVQFIEQIFPLIQAELFVETPSLKNYIHQLIESMLNENIILEDDNRLVVSDEHQGQLHLLASTCSEMLKRYAIIFNLLSLQPKIERSDLERESHQLAKHMGPLHGISAPEFYDRKLYASLTVKLKEMDLLGQSEKKDTIIQLSNALTSLLDAQVRQTVVTGVQQTQNVEAEKNS
ncbi:glycerol-3-phosphate 1-O-acyltransferase [Shewanella sp. OPT22]|nr:glycerol-3-phosphate 1-O-acyltransferase [Shewanella sp. OPT22]